MDEEVEAAAASGAGAAAHEAAAVTSPATGAAVDLAAARDLVLRAHPNVVAELVAGESFADLLASVPAAEAAYQRVAATVAPADPVAAAAALAAVTGPVSAGSGVRTQMVDMDALSPAAKIAVGIAQRQARS